jgi:hypothetical protein
MAFMRLLIATGAAKIVLADEEYRAHQCDELACERHAERIPEALGVSREYSRVLGRAQLRAERAVERCRIVEQPRLLRRAQPERRERAAQAVPDERSRDSEPERAPEEPEERAHTRRDRHLVPRDGGLDREERAGLRVRAARIGPQGTYFCAVSPAPMPARMRIPAIFPFDECASSVVCRPCEIDQSAAPATMKYL